MAQLIEFPKRQIQSAPDSQTLEQSIERAVVACLSLGSKFEGMIADLERSLTVLSSVMTREPGGLSSENARKLDELKDQLARARSMIQTVRRELAPPASH